jgi:hypothetical protein
MSDDECRMLECDDDGRHICRVGWHLHVLATARCGDDSGSGSE